MWLVVGQTYNSHTQELELVFCCLYKDYMQAKEAIYPQEDGSYDTWVEPQGMYMNFENYWIKDLSKLKCME